MSNDFNQSIIAEFRAHEGKVGGHFAGADLLLLTTTGARSSLPYITPVRYITDGDRLVVIASNGGSPRHPDWYFNLLANPVVTIELGSEQFRARAVVAAETERERLFARMAAKIPAFAEYQRSTNRVIPVIILERTA